MAALPYMQFYVADHLGDSDHLSTLEHGAYTRLIFSYWQKGECFKAKDGRTLNDRLARIARVSPEEWEAMRDTLAEFFVTSETEWLHTRIERDLLTVKGKSDQNRENALKGVAAKKAAEAEAEAKAKASKPRAKRPAKPRKQGKNVDVADAERPLSDCLANAERSSSHTDTDTDTDKEKDKTTERAQARADGLIFDQEDLGSAELLAEVARKRAGKHFNEPDLQLWAAELYRYRQNWETRETGPLASGEFAWLLTLATVDDYWAGKLNGPAMFNRSLTEIIIRLQEQPAGEGGLSQMPAQARKPSRVRSTRELSLREQLTDRSWAH